MNLDAEWQLAYKRQAEFYQWLLRGRGLDTRLEGELVFSAPDGRLALHGTVRASDGERCGIVLTDGRVLTGVNVNGAEDMRREVRDSAAVCLLRERSGDNARLAQMIAGYKVSHPRSSFENQLKLYRGKIGQAEADLREMVFRQQDQP